jgi:hypothetical protein
MKGKVMRQLTKVLLALTLASVCALTTALGQTNQQIWSLDENGPALLSGRIVGFANGVYKPDPISGIVGWYYPLGPSVPGDVLLLEPPQTTLTSDLLRFDGQGVFFFSDLEAGTLNPDKADVPVIPNPINPVILSEVGPENNNGAFYFPNPNQPGFDLSGQLPGLAYNIISDIPEPGSLALLLTGVGLLALNTVQRKIRR